MRALALLAALILTTTPAAAAEVDFSPIITPVFAIIGVALSFLVGLVLTWAFRMFRARTGLELVELEDKLRELVNSVAYRAIDAALVAAQKRVGGDKGRIEIDNTFMALAISYVIKAVPDTLKKLGLVKADGTIDESKVRAMIEARLPGSSVTNLPVKTT